VFTQTVCALFAASTLKVQ